MHDKFQQLPIDRELHFQFFDRVVDSVSGVTMLQTVEVPQLQFSLVIVQFLDKAVAAPSLCNGRLVELCGQRPRMLLEEISSVST